MVWETDFGWVDRSSATFNSFLDVFQKIRAKPTLLSLFATTTWSIWYQRNKSRLQENPLPLLNIIGFAKNYLSEFKGLDSPFAHRRQVVPLRWIPPAAGLVKINYGGAMYGESDEARIGVVIWNCKGQVLAALSEQIAKPPIVEILELLVAR